MAVAHVVIIPQRLGHRRPTAAVYARRRWVAVVLSTLLVLALTLGAGTALANRGGDPASTPAVRPSVAPAAPAAAAVLPAPATVYLVQPGDSLWSIAGRFHGQRSRVDYLEALIGANHGTKVLVGQALPLP